MLAGNSLDGPIPGELGDVTTLLKLDLTGNKLSGELPLYVIQLKAKGCDMKLYGNDPGFFLPKDLSALDDSISQLDLSRCSLHGWAFSRAINCCDPSVYSCSSRLRRYLPKTLSSSLEIIKLDGNVFSGPIPKSWTQLPALKTLSKIDCGLDYSGCKIF